jgi:2-polyprenyl-6-methoxyphenol hydroxylase-like FAD-dependent oxidoreductase
MTTREYDVIVVGARSAGAPTAMLLARAGHRVLVVDRATFPSDTVSTHLVHPPGVEAWERWGVLDRIVASGPPPIHTYAFDFGPFTISGSPGHDGAVSYAPRRTVVDKILVDAAAEAGAEVREGFTVVGLESDAGRVVGISGHGRDGRTVVERAAIVVGADGRHSTVAEAVGAEAYDERPHLQASYYAYWSGMPMDGRFETSIRPGAGFAAWPTNDDLTLVIAGRPFAEFETYRRDIESMFLATIDVAPEFAKRLRAGKRETRFVGASVANYFRRPFGPGWVLAGDSGYNLDFVTALGMSDAYLSAEQVASAIDQVLEGSVAFDDAMATYQASRDEHVRPFYEFTTGLATLEAPPPEFAEALAGIVGDQPAMDRFVRVTTGVTSPAELFAPADRSESAA